MGYAHLQSGPRTFCFQMRKGARPGRLASRAALRSLTCRRWAARRRPLVHQRLQLLPAATFLSPTMLWLQLAACIIREQLARIEPVLSSGDGQNPRRGSRELVAVRTSHLPKSAAIWRLVQAEHFFDAAVAVRAHDQHWAGQVADILCAQNHVVMKLALRPVIKQLVRSAASLQCLKQLA